MLKDLVEQVKLIWSEVRYFFKSDSFLEMEPEAPELEEVHYVPTKVFKPKEVTSQGTVMPVAPTNSLESLHRFLNENKDLLHRFVIKEMNIAIVGNLSSIDLFRVGQTPIIARIDSKDYDMVLSDAQQYFIDTQQYEFAQKCKELRDQNKINQFIKTV